MDKPIKSVTHGQWDAKTMVTCSGFGHHCPLIGIKLQGGPKKFFHRHIQ